MKTLFIDADILLDCKHPLLFCSKIKKETTNFLTEIQQDYKLVIFLNHKDSESKLDFLNRNQISLNNIIITNNLSFMNFDYIITKKTNDFKGKKINLEDFQNWSHLLVYLKEESNLSKLDKRYCGC